MSVFDIYILTAEEILEDQFVKVYFWRENLDNGELASQKKIRRQTRLHNCFLSGE